MPDLGVGELLIIAAVLLVLFGSKKLPGAARSLGQSLRIFKAETHGLHHDEEERQAHPQPAPPQQGIPAPLPSGATPVAQPVDPQQVAPVAQPAPHPEQR